MRAPALACVLALAAVATSARADPTRLAVPGQGWSVRFDGPSFKKLDEKDDPGRYSLFGNADRFNLSLYVEPPMCPGGDSSERIHACFLASLKRNPTVLYDTERGNTLPRGGVMVMYMVEGDVGVSKVHAFNVNVLFAHKGKWGDLHVSYVSPRPEDVQALIALAQSVEVVDDPAPPPPASGASAP